MNDFTILVADTLDELQLKIQQHKEQGWYCVGHGPMLTTFHSDCTLTHAYYSQSMGKDDAVDHHKE